MKNAWTVLLCVAAGVALQTATAQDVEPGFKSLFNGKDLTGWAGRTNHWSVEDGCITGSTTPENPAKGNNFLFARDGDKNLIVDDFEIRFSYSFSTPWGNSGLQYRSKDLENFVSGGYQADFEVGTTYSGILYEERGRGILCQRGQKVTIKEALFVTESKKVTDPKNGKEKEVKTKREVAKDSPEAANAKLDTKIEVTGTLGDTREIQTHIHTNGWNDYVIIAKGNHLQQWINGVQTIDVTDEQESKAAKSGVLAFQIHAGPPMKVQFKNVRIKSLK
ncbi:MAG: DUF1080 domain-containing protein [Verrucomicrobiota bacterium]